jgi:hypothetical protein
LSVVTATSFQWVTALASVDAGGEVAASVATDPLTTPSVATNAPIATGMTQVDRLPLISCPFPWQPCRCWNATLVLLVFGFGVEFKKRYSHDQR